MSASIAIDVGGTFTDLVVRQADGTLAAYKSPTTSGRIVDGVFDGLAQIAESLGVTREAFIGSLDTFIFGTTVATNAILEGKAARTGLIVTRGFRETLLVREGGKADTYTIALDFPEPYIPRALTIGVTERINAEGGIETPLDEADVRSAIATLKAEGVEAIAVSLLWSIANPAHERRIGELIEEEWPGVPYSLGHRVNPCIREYRRTSAVALDASLKPVAARSIAELDRRLTEAGFRGTLTYMTSSGGQASVADILAKPVFLCFSGPAAAPEASRRFVQAEGDAAGDIITVDMGGTSFDVSITTGWQVPLHREGSIAGHLFGVPSVEIHTIGAGGGSIARVDRGGFMHVGPASAGSQPGPACYGRGGERATVTDANVVMGLLDPDSFAAGRMRLSTEAAHAAIERDVAKPLGLSLVEAASLVAVTCEENMVGAIADLTIKRGIDPRDYVMVAGGAAAGLHAVAIARELGIGRVLIPRFAGVMSAFGALTSDVVFTFGEALFASSAAFDFEAVSGCLARLEAEANAYLDRMGFAGKAGRELQFSTEARYAGQVWQLTLPLAHRRIADAPALAEVVESFHRLHEQVYSVRSPGDAVELIELNVKAVGRLPDVALPTASTSSAPVTRQRRSAYFRGLGRMTDVAVHPLGELPVGQAVDGPALLEEPLTTIVVPPGHQPCAPGTATPSSPAASQEPGMSKPEPILYLNGAFVPESEAKVSVFDRCFLYGDGIFEGVAVWKRAPFRLEPHLDRLSRGLRYMMIEEPLDHDGWRGLLRELIARNDMEDGYLRIQISRGEGMSSIKWEPRLLRKSTPNVVVIPIAGFAKYYAGLFGRTDAEGLRAITVPRPRIASHAVPTGMKHCNYLGSVLGAIDVTKRGADIGVAVDPYGFVSEGIAYNVFIVQDGELVTPPTTRDMLPGITRETIIELARANGMPVAERDFDAYAMASADEAFICSTLELAVPVVELDGRRIGSGKPGPVTLRMGKLLLETMTREAEAFARH